jgi:PilZ domain-containing protein
VRWVKGDRIGLEFAHETQVAGDFAKRDAMLLNAINNNFPELTEQPASEGEEETQDCAETDAYCRAGLRHPLIWSGEIHYDYESTRVRLRNISEQGAMVDCSKSIPEGAELLLDLGDAGQHFANVSWARGDQLGLRFQRPFDIACLARADLEVAPQSWSRPDYLNASQGTDSPWAEPWERLSVSELRDTLEGFLKR